MLPGQDMFAILQGGQQVLAHVIGGQAWWEPYGDDHAHRTSHQVHKWQMGIQEAGLRRSWLRLY